MACLPGSDPLAEPLLLCHFLPPTLSGLATRSHFHLSSFMLLSQLHVRLVAPSIHRILEPATTCSVFARPSFAQHQICDSLPGPYTTALQPLPLSLCITCTTPTVQAEAGPFLPILEFCLRGSAAPPRASKEGRVHCIALPGCNAAHCGAKRGRHPCNAKCSFLLRSRVERGMALQRGERGGRALVT